MNHQCIVMNHLKLFTISKGASHLLLTSTRRIRSTPLPLHFLNTLFNIILQCTPNIPSSLPPFLATPPKPRCISLLSHVCHLHPPYHHSSFDYPHNIWTSIPVAARSTFFQPLVTASVLGSIFSSAPSSQTSSN